MGISNIVTGAVNLGKAMLDIADPKVEILSYRRTTICLSCDKISRFKQRCTLCGCLLEAKTRVEEEHCPINKW